MKITNQKTADVQSVVDAMIPRDTTFNGDIETKSNLRIDGHIKGNIVSTGNVAVGPEGHVEGSISGKEVSIAGKVSGNLNATGAVQLSSGARLIGDLLAISLLMEQGAYYKGTCIIGEKQKDTLAIDGNTIPLKTAVS